MYTEELLCAVSFSPGWCCHCGLRPAPSQVRRLCYLVVWYHSSLETTFINTTSGTDLSVRPDCMIFSHLSTSHHVDRHSVSHPAHIYSRSMEVVVLNTDVSSTLFYSSVDSVSGIVSISCTSFYTHVHQYEKTESIYSEGFWKLRIFSMYFY